MPSLTPQLLRNFPYARQADPRVVQRGRAYFNENRVTDVDLVNASTAVCQVMGDEGDYEVEIQAVSGQPGLSFRCDCPRCGEMTVPWQGITHFNKEKPPMSASPDPFLVAYFPLDIGKNAHWFAAYAGPALNLPAAPEAMLANQADLKRAPVCSRIC